jgi:hypothetical protein
METRKGHVKESQFVKFYLIIDRLNRMEHKLVELNGMTSKHTTCLDPKREKMEITS